MRAARPSFSIAFRSFWLTSRISARVVFSYRMQVRPRRSLGSLEPLAWRIKVRRMPRTPPKRPASKTTLSRGEAWPDPGAVDGSGLLVVQSSCANTNAAKSTSRVSSSRRSNVVVPGLKDVVHGSTCATSSRPPVSACSSFSCFPDEPRKMRGLVIHSSRQQFGRAVPMMPPDRGAEETADGTLDCPRHAVGQKGAYYVRTAYRANDPIRIRADQESR